MKILGGQKNNLINAFEEATLSSESNDKRFDNNWINDIAACILPLSTNSIYGKFTNSENTPPAYYLKNGIKIQYKLSKSNMRDLRLDFIYAEFPVPPSINLDTLKVLFIEAINVLDKNGLLN